MILWHIASKHIQLTRRISGILGSGAALFRHLGNQFHATCNIVTGPLTYGGGNFLNHRHSLHAFLASKCRYTSIASRDCFSFIICSDSIFGIVVRPTCRRSSVRLFISNIELNQMINMAKKALHDSMINFLEIFI